MHHVVLGPTLLASEGAEAAKPGLRGSEVDELVDLGEAADLDEARSNDDLLEVLRIERRLERSVALHLLDQALLSGRPRGGEHAFVDEKLATRNKGSSDHLERLDLVVEVVHRVVEDRGVESALPRHLPNGQCVELRLGLDAWPTSPSDATRSSAISTMSGEMSIPVTE